MPTSAGVQLLPKDLPQTLADYADRSDLYAVFEDLLKGLLIAKPDEPIAFCIEALKEGLRTVSLYTFGEG